MNPLERQFLKTKLFIFKFVFRKTASRYFYNGSAVCALLAAPKPTYACQQKRFSRKTKPLDDLILEGLRIFTLMYSLNIALDYTQNDNLNTAN